jgi:hypothetical protein
MKQPQGILAALPEPGFRKVLQIHLGDGRFPCLQSVVWHPTLERVLRAVNYAKSIKTEAPWNGFFDLDHQALQILALVGSDGWNPSKGDPDPLQACQKMDRQLMYWKNISNAGSAYWLGTGMRADGPGFARELNQRIRANPTKDGVGRVLIDHQFTERQYRDPHREVGADKGQWSKETDRELLQQLTAHILNGGPRWGVPPCFHIPRSTRSVTRMLPMRYQAGPDEGMGAGLAVRINEDTADLEEWTG